MNHFQTIAVFTYPTDLFVAKSFLESHNIECFVRDEMTIQVHNFYSNAIGGIKLDVAEKDYEKARDLLIQNGFIDEGEEEKTQESQNEWITKFDKVTSKIPIFKSLNFSTRAIILFISAILLIGVPAYFISLPSTQERLTNGKWCLSHITYKGKNYAPSSTHIRFIFSGECKETIEFKDNGIIELPGFQSYPIVGQWQIEDDRLRIFGSDNFEHIYDGNYELNFNGRELIIASENSILFCFR
tara:strand:- start:844 stop:1569 length:726 start_codon:yes stop_codon:yes gene_type:complete